MSYEFRNGKTVIASDHAIIHNTELPLMWQETDDPTGFVDTSQVSLTWSNANRKLTIAPASSSFSFYINGDRFEKIASESIVIANTEGLHYIYYDITGTLQETTTFSLTLYTEYAYVAVVSWDGTNAKQIYFGREYHLARDGATHAYLHETIHTALESGGGIGGLTVDDASPDETATQFAIESTIIWDEGLRHVLSAKGVEDTVSVYYRTGADSSNIWRVKETDEHPLVLTGNIGETRAAWNQLSGGTWSLVQTSAQDFLLAHIFAFNDTDRQYGAIVGQDTYGSISAARDGSSSEIQNLILAGLPFEEFKFLGTLIVQVRDGDTDNPYLARTRSVNSSGDEYVDLRSSIFPTGNTSATVVDHGALAGLLDNDHPQYQLVTDDAILTVNGDYYGKVLTVTVDDASTAFGNVLYVAADFHYERAQADSDSTIPAVVMALEAGDGSGKLVLEEGQICNTDWDWSAGLVYVDDDTAGGLTQTPPSDTGDQVQAVGWALSADTIYFRPDQTYLEIA